MDHKERNQIILQLTCELLEKINVEVEKAFVEDVVEEVEGQEEKETAGEQQVLVSIQVANPGSLIGYRGKNLAAVQLILALMVKKKLGEWVRVLLDVNSYRQEQKVRLEKMATSAAEKAISENRAIPLVPMSSFERRICHMVLAEMEGISSDSEGEGEERHVVVKPKV
jgi:spoIIIJ-associated protein